MDGQHAHPLLAGLSLGVRASGVAWPLLPLAQAVTGALPPSGACLLHAPLTACPWQALAASSPAAPACLLPPLPAPAAPGVSGRTAASHVAQGGWQCAAGAAHCTGTPRAMACGCACWQAPGAAVEEAAGGARAAGWPSAVAGLGACGMPACRTPPTSEAAAGAVAALEAVMFPLACMACRC